MISVTKTPHQLWNKGQGIAMLVNTDLLNPVYVDYGSKAPDSNSDQIPPLGTIAVDGSVTIQASTLDPNISILVQVMPGVSQWAPSPAQIAAQIALKGINVNIQGLTVVNPSGDITGVSDTNAVTNAFNLSNHVVLAPGTFWFPTNSRIAKLTDFQWLQGSGPATTVKMIANDANPFGIFVGCVDKANATRISDMILDGNKVNQTAFGPAFWQTCFLNQNSAPGTFYTDGRHQAGNLIIQNFAGDGFVQTGRGSSQYDNIQVFQCDGFGMNVHEDCYYDNIDVGASGIDNILEQGASNQWGTVKSWFSGAKLVSSRIAGATLLTVNGPAGGNAWDGAGIAGLVYSLANGWGDNFHVANISAAAIGSAGSGGTIGAGYFQDGARAGYHNENGSQNRTIHAVAERNNNNGTNGGVPNGGYAGFDINTSNITIRGQSMMTSGNVNQQAAALNIGSSGNDCDIELGFKGTLNDGSNMPPLTAGSNPVKAKLNFKAANGASYFNPGFAASFTPDPFRAQVIEITSVTANITINAPALGGGTGNVTGFNAPFFTHPGQRLTLILTEDAVGGHTVTFNAAYLVGNAANTAAFNTNVWEFVQISASQWAQVAYSNP